MIGTVDIKTRPLRLAYLVDPNNAAQVREAIRLSSTLWGGAYFPIIPLYRRIPATWAERPFKLPRAQDVVLGYLEAFDPDILVQFSNDVPSFIKGVGLRVIKPEEVWNTLDEGKVLSPNFGIGIFELLDDIFDKHFRYTPKYPLRVVIPNTPSTLSLFWASWLGEIPSRIMPLIEESYFEPLDIHSMNFTVDKLGDVMARSVLFPRRIAQYGLKPFKRSRFSGEVYVYFLDATALGDVVDFWNLRALGRSVIPVPKQLQGDAQLREVVLSFLKVHRQPGRLFVDVMRARNVTIEEVRGYVQILKADYGSADSSNDPVFGIHERYPRIWDEWARGKDSSAEPIDLYGDVEQSIEVTELRVRFRNQLPEFADRRGFHYEPRCANEIELRLFGNDRYLAEAFPKSVGRNLLWAISGLGSFSEWRVGRNGLVKLVEGHFSATLDIPTAERIFFAWLTDLGWVPQLSPPGRLAKEIYKRLQGNPSVLKNEALLDLLERMNGGKVKQDIPTVDVEQEKELSVGEVKERLERSSEGRNLHDYLISRGVFKLGLKVQCPNCLRNTWFSLENLADDLTCPKCLNSFPAIGNVASPDWSYKTTGPFSVPRYAEGAYAVLLTLQLLGGNKTLTLRTTPVLSFNAIGQDKKALEADFAMFWQESILGEKGEGLLFGECKTYGVFKKKDVDRMRYLAEIFPGAVLVFSTLRPSLNPDEISIITRLAKIGRKYWKPERPINPVMILTGTELFHAMRPPQCWDLPVQIKFDQTGGLVGLCDITQQIHLNLPSWHTEWQEKWKKRRQRLQARKNS